jgi:hypothetical protein
MSDEISQEEFEHLSAGPVRSTVESWRGQLPTSGFVPDDVDLLDLALSAAPALRAATMLVKTARERGFGYPVESATRVSELLGGDLVEAGEFTVPARALTEAIPPEFFPLAHEGELLSALHMAFLRCRAEAVEAWQRAGVERRAAQDVEVQDVGQ